MAGDPLKARLVAGAQELGIALDAVQAAALMRLLTELREWNTRFNLTAIREPVDMVDKHLLDSLSIQPYLHGRRIADSGTGAGFPGLPLAVVNPRRQFTLIEATGKKVQFVRHAIEALRIENVEIVQARAETWRPRAPFDSVIARALGERLGVDPHADLRPTLIAGAANAAIRSALVVWEASHGRASLQGLVLEAFELLESGFGLTVAEN